MIRTIFLLLFLLSPALVHAAESFTFTTGPRTILEDATPASITNSVAVTTLASLTLPANSIAANGSLEIFVWIRYVNNSAISTQNPKITVNLGGVQIGGTNKVSPALAPSTGIYGYYCHIWVKNLNAMNAQSVLTANFLSDPARQFTVNFPDQIDGAQQRTVAIDLSIANLLTVTAQNDFADPGYTTFYDGITVK